MSEWSEPNNCGKWRVARLHHLFERQVARSPEAIAITLGSSSVTYSELNSRANGIAHALRDEGIEGGALVGVAVDRSIDTLASLLGVLKSGAAYVPFEANLPIERMAYILNQATIEVLVGSTAALAIAQAPRVRKLDAGAVPGSPESPLATGADTTAWVIFTSGSTGRPKGVVVEHAQIVHSTLARLDVFPLPCQSYVMLAPFSFDASAAAIYLTLSTGGRLVVPTGEEVLDPALLADLVVAEKAAHLDGVPSQYATIVAFHPEVLAQLRCCIVAGEALQSALVDDHYAAAPDTPLFNEYGPTEGTVWSAVHRCRPGERGATAPIGRPIRGVRIHVLDAGLNPVPRGETGELHIAGRGLAREYLGEPGLTADRFLPDPYGEHPGERLYRTGDLGAIDENGNLLFRGRIDNQVKVRGFRVELEEVEAALLAHPGVAACAVVPRTSPTGVRLAAYIVAHGNPATADQLSATVRARVPDFMVPSEWHAIDRMPLTPNGKIDRRSLSGGDRPDGDPVADSAVADGRTHLVVRNDAGTYSVWPADRLLPDGWFETGRHRGRKACLTAIERAARLRRITE